ncbi:MAG: hypothetical protein KJ685_05215 [Nanoarchaeota archaeon]|nr:hypothetical protein [Nanoarchaeota archaeon]MBU2442425.1 hypothetical protein [Nanoarchaeota archaeon]
MNSINPEENIRKLEETRNEIIRFTNELDEKLRTNQIDGIEYHVMLNEKLGGKHKEELIRYIDQKILEEQSKIKDKEHSQRKKKTAITFSAAAIVLVLIVIVGILYTTPDALTGFTTLDREVQELIEYDRVFDHYTETPLELEKITSLKISGILEGTGAIVKLRIGDIEYLVADITNQEEENLISGLVIAEEPEYLISTDKNEYALGETVYITIEPEADDRSVYVSYGEETQQLDDDSYITEQTGEHTIVALIVLPDDILRLESAFTVIEQILNETNQTNETIPEEIPEEPEIEINTTINETNQTNETITETYTFEALCTDTCNLNENSNPILIVELEEGSVLTITDIIVVQNKENNAPEQIQNIPDITITTTQTATLNLDEYFSDADGDLVAYDLNEIAEITTEMNQEILTISSDIQGTYTAYIYATDGDKLVTSNTFEITITEVVVEETNQTNQTIPEINTTEINQTINETNTTETNISEHSAELNETAPEEEPSDPCLNSDLNLRPAYCFVGIEEKVFRDLSAEIENNRGEIIGRFTKFGNLVIRGLIVQETTGSPDSDDFRVGYTETIDYDEISTDTAWIDSATGNLHLKGRLYDEEEVLTPPQHNTFIIQNKFSIVLGYFNELTGDLHLKGNIVQLGKI